MKIKINEKEKEDLKSIIELLKTNDESNRLLGVSLVKKYKRFYKYICIFDSNSYEAILCKKSFADYYDEDYYVAKYSDIINYACNDNNPYILIDFLNVIINEIDAFYQK